MNIPIGIRMVKYFYYICTRLRKPNEVLTQKGTLAEWLGNGLQNRVRRFESARYLKKTHLNISDGSFYFQQSL